MPKQYALVETFPENNDVSIIAVGDKKTCKTVGRKVLRDNGYYENARHLVDDFNKDDVMIENDYTLQIVGMPEPKSS